MTAPISIKYEDWVAVIDDANKAQERVKKLETALKIYALRSNWHIDTDDHYAPPLSESPIVVFDADDYNQIILFTYGGEIARKALEE